MSERYCESCSKEPIGTINVSRVISKLDECFSRNDMAQAGETLRFWQAEAERLGDRRGLLSVVNEELGYYRKTGDEERGLSAVRMAVELLDELGIDGVSASTVIVNIATTMKAFGLAKEALPYYEKAERSYIAQGKADSYEFAALLNNRALSYAELGKFAEAENDYLRAIDILKKIGGHDGEIAASLINMAHAVFDADDTAYEKVEGLLDECWEYINSDSIPRNADYAQIILKCAPSFRYFQREIEADALEEVAAEIYNGAKK